MVLMIDNTSYKVLKTLYKIKSIPETKMHEITGHDDSKSSDPIVTALLVDGLIKLESGASRIEKDGRIFEEEGDYRITINGMAYVDQRKRDLFNFWVPYSITTLVAIIGLLVAIAGFLRDDLPAQNTDTQNPSHSQVQTSDRDISCK